MIKSVGVYPSDATGSGMYRMHLPGKAVAATGKPVMVMPRAPQITVDQFGKIHGINTGSFEAVVFQRTASHQFTQVIPILQKQGVKVILDFDDSLSTIHPRNVAFKSYDPRVSRERNWMHAARAAELADLVTVTTEGLLEEYGYGHGIVIPNHIPRNYLEIQRPVNDVPIVTWAGWTSTHPDDLYECKGMINQVLIDTGAKFAAFGDENIFRDLGIRRRPPHELWGFTSILDYPKTLIKADIGLVPLKKSKFNSCKSALKILEYSSLGIVPIASPTPDNLRLKELGMGIIAETPKDWYDRTKELIFDGEMRRELSDKMRKIASDFTIEGNSDLWWQAWSS